MSIQEEKFTLIQLESRLSVKMFVEFSFLWSQWPEVEDYKIPRTLRTSGNYFYIRCSVGGGDLFTASHMGTPRKTFSTGYHQHLNVSAGCVRVCGKMISDFNTCTGPAQHTIKSIFLALSGTTLVCEEFLLITLMNTFQFVVWFLLLPLK